MGMEGILRNITLFTVFGDAPDIQLFVYFWCRYQNICPILLKIETSPQTSTPSLPPPKIIRFLTKSKINICFFVIAFAYLFCDILMTMLHASILDKIKLQKQRSFPKTCSKQSLIFSSAVYNYILFCIVKQRKFEKNQKWNFKLELKIVK